MSAGGSGWELAEKEAGKVCLFVFPGEGDVSSRIVEDQIAFPQSCVSHPPLPCVDTLNQ